MATTISPQKYAEFLNQFELGKIGFSEISSKLYPEIYKPDRIEIEVANAVEIGPTHVANQYGCKNTYTLTGRREGKVALEIKASIFLLFISKIRPDTEIIQIFQSRNLPLITFPFFRELVNSLTGRMGIPPLTLPLLSLIRGKTPGLGKTGKKAKSQRRVNPSS